MFYFLKFSEEAMYMSSISLYSSKRLVYRILIFDMVWFYFWVAIFFENKCVNLLKYTKHLTKKESTVTLRLWYPKSEGAAFQNEEKGLSRPLLWSRLGKSPEFQFLVGHLGGFYLKPTWLEHSEDMALPILTKRIPYFNNRRSIHTLPPGRERY